MTEIHHLSTKSQNGTGFRRLTVHVNGPSVQFADPLKEYRTVSDDGRKIKNKQRIINTLSFTNIQDKDVPSIIAGVKSKYSNLEKTRNMPDGIKWYLSWMK
jgi:hypothetical protein